MATDDSSHAVEVTPSFGDIRSKSKADTLQVKSESLQPDKVGHHALVYLDHVPKTLVDRSTAAANII